MYRRPRRRGTTALETVICAAVLTGIAAVGYAIARGWLEQYLFDLGTGVGWPLL